VSDTTVQPDEPPTPVAHVPSYGVTFGPSGASPLSERCTNPPQQKDQLHALLEEWHGLYDNPYGSKIDSQLYADFFLLLRNALQQEAVVTQLVVSYFERRRPRGMFRRSYDALCYAEVKAMIAEVLSDLPTRQFPLPHELAKAFRAFEFILQTFRWHPLIPLAPHGRKWLRNNEAQAIDWLRSLYYRHIMTNFNG